MKKGMESFAFLAHKVRAVDFLRDYEPFQALHEKAEAEKQWQYRKYAPIYLTASVLSILDRKGFNVVDRYSFAGMRGQTILLNNYAWHFLSDSLKEQMRDRILRAVLSAQESNQVIGLGALIKNEKLTQGGKWIVDQLGNQLEVPLVHGDTLTAATVLKQIDAIRKEYGIDSPVFITGATSKIGRAVCLVLAKNKVFVKMFTRDEGRFMAIKKEAGEEFGKYLSRATSLADGQDCQLWLTGKSEPSGKKLLQAIPRGAMVVNSAVPGPLQWKKLHSRPDLTMIEGGLLAYDTAKTDLSHTMRLSYDRTYACHAGTIVHAYQGWTHHEVGPVEIPMLHKVWDVAQEIGFFLPELPMALAQETQEAREVRPLWQKLANAPISLVL